MLASTIPSRLLIRCCELLLEKENWSAFAPDFKELEENIEYIEREDEFDIVDEAAAIKKSSDTMDEDVDVITVETINFGSR